MIVWIYAEWCGHCVRFLPLWKSLVQENKSINFVVLNGDDDITPLPTYPQVRGYPTIWTFAAGSATPVEFRGQRTKPAIQMKLNAL